MKSRLLDFKKNKNDKYINEEEKRKKLNYIDKLFIRIFLSSLILFILISLDNIKLNKVNVLLNDNINFIKLAKVFNGNFGSFISENIEDTVYSSNTYDEVLFNNDTKINTVYNYGFDGIYNLENGIVTKIIKNKDNLYEVTIKGYDGFNYTYLNVESIDYHIYSYIGNNNVLGLSRYDEKINCFTFDLKIEKDGIYYDYYTNAKS